MFHFIMKDVKDRTMNDHRRSTLGKWLIVPLAFLLSLFMVHDFHAQQHPPLLVLTDEQDTYDLVDHVEIFVDQSTDLTFDQVTSGQFNGEFEPAGEVDTRSGEAAYWLRLEMENESSPSTSWLLI